MAAIAGPRLYATCTPSVSTSVSGTTLTIDASVSGTCGGSTLKVYLDGTQITSKTCTTSTCTLTHTRSTACLKTGLHTVQAVATCSTQSGSTCVAAPPGSATSSFTVNTTPTVAATYLGPSDTGAGTLQIDYSFPNTTASGQRDIFVYIDGRSGTDTYATSARGDVSGTWLLPMNVSCWTPGAHPIRVVARACDGSAADGYRAEASTSVMVETTPSIDISYDGPDELGSGSLSMTYEFLHTAASTQRDLFVYLDGATNNDYHATSARPDVRGTWTIPLDVTCWTPGDHPIRVVAKACDGDLAFRDEATTSVFADTKPSLSATYLGPDENGNGSLSIDYTFRHTPDAQSRDLFVYLDGAADFDWIATSSRPDITGNWTLPLNTACWTPGDHHIRVVAKACDGDPRYRTEVTTTVTVNHQPEVEVDIRKTAAGGTEAVVRYEFPQTNASSQRLLHLEWLPAGGAVTADFRPTDTEGEWVVALPNCAPSTKALLRATAMACSGVSAEDTAEVDECATSCSLECPDCVAKPIKISNGNMQMSDRDALPSGDLGGLNRTYNSRGRDGVFGKGWTSVFDARATIVGTSVYIDTDNADRYYFTRDASGVYTQTFPAGDRSPTALFHDAGRNVYVHRNGADGLVRIYRGTDGRLIGVRHPSHAEEIAITYDANGRPLTVQDPHGAWSWTISSNAAGLVESVAVTGETGFTWTYAYDAQNNLRTVTNGSGTWRTYTYGAAGMEDARDGAGRLLEGHVYDAAGNAVTSTQDADDVTNIVYGVPGRVPGETATRVVSASGRETLYYSRRVAGKVRTVEVAGSCDCGTEDTVYGYDGEGHISREQNARGYVTTRLFSGERLLEETTSLRPAGCDPATDSTRCRLTPDDLMTVLLTATPATTTRSFTYADAGWPERPTRIRSTSIINPSEFRDEEYAYDLTTGQILVHRIVGWTGSPAVQQTHTTTTALYNGVEGAAFNPGGSFDPAWLTLPQPGGARKSIDGPRTDVTDVTTFVHYPADASVPARLRGKLAAMRNAAGHITRWEAYDIFGSPTRTVDVNGVVTESTYDNTGRLLTSTLKGVPGCNTTADPLCATDIMTTRTYEASNGLLASEERPGGVAVFTYDDAGRMTTVSRGPSVADLRERRETVYEAATGNKTSERSLEYTGGNWIERQRENYVYDAFGRLSQLTHPDSTSIGYTYTSGLLSGVRDENHATPNTTYQYDPAGRLEQVTQTLAGAPGGMVSTSYTYDAMGNLAAVVDPNGNTTTYVYDDFRRMTRQTSPVSGVTTYSYDPAGNLISMTDANGAVTNRTYDELGRVTAAVATRGTDSESATWTYDSGTFGTGRMTSMTDPVGVVTYAYERRGLVRQEQRTIGTATYTTTFAYDAAGNRSVVGYPSGRAVQYGFDYAGRPVSAAVDAVSLVTSAAYAPFGPMKEIVYGNGARQESLYDTRYRLTSRRVSVQATSLVHHQYAYDNAGNITAIEDLLDSAYDRDFTYDDLNRLRTATTGSSLWGSATYDYDRMGNMLAATVGTRTSAFTYAGTTPKLTAAVENGTSRAVAYDAAGNETAVGAQLYTYSPRNSLATRGAAAHTYDGRGVRTITTTAAGNRYFLYMPELTLLGETETTPSAAPAITHEYISFAGQPLAQIETSTSTISWYHNDHLGTPTVQTDNTATIVWQADYDPYGTLHTHRTGAPRHQPLTLPGQEQDGTEERYNVFRWYRAGWGRYTQADPLGRKGDPHPYAYALDNPVRYIDPLGLRVRVCCKIIPAFSAIGARHCYFQFDQGWPRTVGLHGTQSIPGYILATLGMDTGTVQEDNGFDRDPTIQATCGPWKGCDADDCVKDAARTYPSPSRYFFLGPNSNAFAGNISRECGLTPPPLETERAPGWSQGPPAYQP